MSKPQELIIKDLKVGTGSAVKDGDRVVMHYTGWLEEPIGSGKAGKKFDSSLDRDEPFETPIGVGYVIKGWDLGVVGMKVGGKRRLTIPHELGYGKFGAGSDIPGFATLIFDVELLNIK
jgi:FKBP-type peptidyl-prolyl cis-trans isomerase